VYGELARIFEQRSTAEWMALLEEADIPMMPMHDLQSVLTDPHLVATNFFSTVEHPSEGTIRSMRMPMTWSDSTPEPARHAPRLGEHSVEVLQQAGFSAAEIDALIAAGAVQACSPQTAAARETP
jgi:crotonobetainyl-CoA:carnitine CoA-transferase CaiB-like acyl-CoA transferase